MLGDLVPMGLLREVFGPSKNEIWTQLSQEIGADYQPDGFFKNAKVVLTHRQWQITLDTYVVSRGKGGTVVYTRMRAPFVNPDGFRFNIYRESIFSWLGKLLGMQDIQIGDEFFDEEFVIQGTSERVVKRLLGNEAIRRLIQSQSDIHFSVKDDEGWFGLLFPDGVDELYFETCGVIKDKHRLKELFALFSLVLTELCSLGVAYAKAPSVNL